MENIQSYLHKLFTEVGEDETHGYEHALRVKEHTQIGLKEYVKNNILKEYEFRAVLYAALLHDADDHKIFKKSTDYENAKNILYEIDFKLSNLVIDMIKYVSFSSNKFGNSENHIPKWQLIPRDADRLEAIGEIGIARCIAYGYQYGRPLYTSETKRCYSVEEIKQYSKYSYNNKLDTKCSLDYFYNGLVPRGIMSSGIKYFKELAEQRLQPIYKLLLIFGEKGYVDKQDVLNCVTKDQMAINLINKYMID